MQRIRDHPEPEARPSLIQSSTASPEDVFNNKVGRIHIIIMRQSHQDSKSGDVIADINYFAALGTPIPKSGWKTRYLDDNDDFTRSMIIRNVRTSNKTFSLDTNGFEFVQLSPKQRVSRDDDQETVKREYYPELESIAKELYSPVVRIRLHKN
jgi:hypothetical protein